MASKKKPGPADWVRWFKKVAAEAGELAAGRWPQGMVPEAELPARSGSPKSDVRTTQAGALPAHLQQLIEKTAQLDPRQTLQVRLGRSTLNLTANPTGRLEPEPDPELAPEATVLQPTEAELSPGRLAMIGDFMRGDYRLQEMKDPVFMYKVVSDERSYQVRVLGELKARAQQSPAEGERLRPELEKTEAIVRNLFKLLKRITQKKGKTGGTGWLDRPDDEQPVDQAAREADRLDGKR